ncbi:MAG TPA: hypothetical protein VFA18_09230 [Gemmataceae bacterium]|nr:hypothetical protein [Gemmataceae bacterium]
MRCPVCKAENAQGPQCRRCRADLSLLFTLETQHQRQLSAARQAVRAGQWEQAETLAGEALAHHSTPEALRLLAVCRLLRRNFMGTLRSYLAQQRS